MKIYTLNIGQGQFVVITNKNQAIIIDTYVPLNPKHSEVNIKGALADILKDKEFIGLIVTGFDDDHFDEVGLKIILYKYRPKWIIYPKYTKHTKNATKCFSVIKEFDAENNIERIPLKLTKNSERFYTGLSTDFTFEVFSPHEADMDSSNNCSVVVKVLCKYTGLTYLATGDTENSRWESIAMYFGSAIKSDVLDAPHHGSKNGITENAIRLIEPDTVLISAGVENQYNHPDIETVKLCKKYAKHVWQTNAGEGQSLITYKDNNKIKTFKY